MQLTIDSGESKENLRLAASFLLHLAGDIVEEPTAADHTHLSAPPGAPAAADPNKVFPSAPVPPPPPPAPTAAVPPPPPPPPPAPSAAAVSTAVSASEAPPHTFPTSGAAENGTGTASAAAAPPAASAGNVTSHSEVDSAGLPWDARIHQKKKSKKQDGTWKLQKGIDMKLVEAVVAELAAKKLPASVAPGTQLDIVMPQQTGTVPPPPASSTVPVPPAPVGPAAGAMPVPPPPAAPAVPAPPVASSVPAAAAPPVGALPAATGYRELIQKCSAATKSGKLDPVKLQSIVTARGAPNVQGLRDMPHLIADVDADIEALLLGVA